MNRALLVVAEREAAGWDSGGATPLLRPPESATHAALCAAGFSVEVVGEGLPRFEAVLTEHRFVVMARPAESSLRKVETAMSSSGGCLLRVQDRPGENTGRGPRFLRKVLLAGAGEALRISRLPRRSRIQGWRERASLPPLAILRPGAEDEVMGRWAGGGGPALLCRTWQRLKVWTTGFPPDHLGVEDLARLMALLGGEPSVAGEGCSPVPHGARAAVMLLHDVEEPLPGDERGLKSVREGTEACLELEARYGFRATYNLVGTFAERIPDLVSRMAAEGHEIASHSTSHREIPGLDAAALLEEVQGAEERIARICGARIRGFRSPRSRWTGPLLDLLEERGYLWNAEADASPYPYPVPRRARGGLVRVPVAVDDWDYVRHRASPRQVLDLWKREVLAAEERGCWVGIGSHPSVLGIEAGRLKGLQEFLEWLSGRDVRVMTLGEASAWWLRRISSAPREAREDRG